MASSKLTVPILINWNDIQAYMEQHDIVKVVRCRDCIHSRPDEYGLECMAHYRPTINDGFCNYGEEVTG